ncbi:DUF2249 domain-containing protein [Mesorhizobium sp. B2-3-15]|uniref:DUF2249 domain-containing protein n=1 Tax=Mesorhizobium sp. B2-3-15 TaxID=2589949 RepID=UPI00112B2A88|nr:DUF2249 domain-containing protein [Mesorhizobium sp. B2-3-15]TPL71530.1 DUF2249 domain-containing protein [Mesorhizobium sp. B2-3-15]
MALPYYDVDVRPILREGGEPFSAIMAAVEALVPGQSLRLLATFKPIPLFHVLGNLGFEPAAREIGNGDWEVIFTPADQQPDPVAPEPAPAVDRTPASETWPAPVVELDNRDLEPPEPLVRTLEGVEALSPGQTLVALLPREPIFLLEELQARGHLWRGALEPDGHYRVVIRRG